MDVIFDLQQHSRPQHPAKCWKVDTNARILPDAAFALCERAEAPGLQKTNTNMYIPQSTTSFRCGVFQVLCLLCETLRPLINPIHLRKGSCRNFNLCPEHPTLSREGTFREVLHAPIPCYKPSSRTHGILPKSVHLGRFFYCTYSPIPCCIRSFYILPKFQAGWH